MNTPTRCLLLLLSVLTIVLFACGDDEDPTQPVLVKPPAEQLNGTYELLDFREWGFMVSGGGGGWGDVATRTDYSYTPASYETHSGHMVMAEEGMYRLFVQDGDSVRAPTQVNSITYTDETDQGEIDCYVGFQRRTIVFDCTDMDLRFDYLTEVITNMGAEGETTRWEIWRKVSDATVPLW